MSMSEELQEAIHKVLRYLVHSSDDTLKCPECDDVDEEGTKLLRQLREVAMREDSKPC